MTDKATIDSDNVKKLYPLITGLVWNDDYTASILPMVTSQITHDRVASDYQTAAACYLIAHYVAPAESGGG